MNRKILTVVIVFVVTILAAVTNIYRNSYSGEEQSTAEEKKDNELMIAHAEVFGKLERPPVVFNHRLHADKYRKEGCKTCHPQNEEGNFVFDFKDKIFSQRESLMDLYHDKCIDCHTRLIKAYKKAGPVKCGSCHRKEPPLAAIIYPLCEFDFYLHDKHVKKLDKDCSYCHHIYDEDEEDEELRLVYEEGTEQSCYYCHDQQKKRGPTLAVETRLTDKKGLSIRKVSHFRCLNCHLDYNRRSLKAGPLTCLKCHTGKYKTVTELAKVARPNRDQPEKPFINIEEAKMKGVLFDHKFHEKNSRTCRSCHHETLKACKDCHGLIGSPDGKEINTSGAFHDVFSEIGCAGCHRVKKSEKDCAGCHHHLLDVDLQAKGPKKAVCSVCHSGKREGRGPVQPISVSELFTKKIPEKVTIKLLEKEYEESTFPHRKMIKKLVEISNENKMATYFHRNMQTLCEGCHHQSRAEAEGKKNTPPFCKNCHSLTFDSQNLNKPRLLAVYHRQCMGCHEKMNVKAKGCTDCHKEKAVQPASILSKTTNPPIPPLPYGS